MRNDAGPDSDLRPGWRWRYVAWLQDVLRDDWVLVEEFVRDLSLKMGVRDWHPGQLVVFWIFCVVAAVVAAILLVIVSTGKENDLIWAFITTMPVASVPALVVTWIWFGNRRKPPPPA